MTSVKIGITRAKKIDLLLSALFLFSTFSHGQDYIAEAVSNNFTYVNEFSDEYEYLSETRKQTLDEALAEINREKPQQETKENETTSIISKFVLSLLWALFLFFTWTLGIIRAFLYVNNSSISKSRYVRLLLAWLLSFVLGITVTSSIVGVVEIFSQWIKYRARKHMTREQAENEGYISIWTEGKKDDVIKLIYAFVIWPLLALSISQIIFTEIYMQIMYRTNKDIAFAAMSFAVIWSYFWIILPSLLIRFIIARRKLKYGLEMSLSLALSFYIPVLLYYSKTGDIQLHYGIWDMLMIYCILSYKSSDYSKKWYSFRFSPILFMIITMFLMTIISGIITKQKQWYIPIWETIFACCMLLRHKNKTTSGELEQHKSTYNEPRQEIHVNNNQDTHQSVPATADTLIDIGLAHIGRKTAYDNQYLTPELTAERHNIEHTFIQALAQTFTDEKTRSGLSRHFMLYKELTLFIVFNMVLKKDKELHTKIQSKLKEHLSLGLSADTLKKRNDYWRKLSQKFHESYTRTHDMAGTLEYMFWSILPESIKSKGIFGRENLYDLFLYTYNAIEQEYKRYVKQVWGIK